MMAEVQTVCYDRDSDVLYISTQPGKPGVVRESLPGVLWRYGPEDGEIVGVTVLDFSHYWKPRIEGLVRDLENRLHISARKARLLLSKHVLWKTSTIITPSRSND